MSEPIPQGIEVLVLKAAVDPDFKIQVPEDDFKKIGTAGETIDYVAKALNKKVAPPPPPVTKGIRPDRPPAKP
jgi:hypothetical protein